MQTKDIDPKPILAFLQQHAGRWCTWGEGHSMPTVQEAMPGVPEKLQLAVMRKLIKRGLVDGCACGCRGDFKITQKGVAFLEEKR